MKRNSLHAAVMAALAAPRSAARGESAPPASILRVSALANGEAELLIYGPIGESYWTESTTAQSVVRELSGISATTIQVRINSDGGSVPDGLAIYNALKRHPARIIVTVDGIAASIASLIAMSGDEVVMPDNSMMMVHAPWTYAGGNALELRNIADVLDTYADAMATSYSAKTGKPVGDITALLTDGQDHYYTAAQAVEFGFADRTYESAVEQADESAAAASLLSYINALSKAPAAFAGALRKRVHAAATPRIFASLNEAIQRAVIAHTEDDTMKQQYLQIMANAGGAAPSPTPAANPTPIAPAAAAVAPAAPSIDPVQAAMTALAERNQRIRGVFGGFRDMAGVAALESECLADPTMTVEAAQGRLLARMGADGAPLAGGGPRVEAGADSRDKFINGVSNAVLARAGLAKPEAGNEYSGIRLQSIIRSCLRNAGVSGADRMEGVQLADKIFALHGTTDFPLLTANTANKALRAAYDLAQPTYRLWCAIGEVSDFKSNSRLQVGTFNSLAEIAPGGEYTYGNLSEDGESIRALTKGKGLALTRQLIINDDLGVFIGAARLLGFAAARTVNEDVYARLAAATAMSDGGALFNATAVTTAGGHANLTSSGTAISVASVAVGEAAMAAQKDAALRTALNIAPRFLLAPRGKRMAAWEVLNSTADPSSSNSNKRNYAASLGLELVTDAELDKASTTAWYLAADPNVAPLIEVDFLDGVQTPYVAEAIDWDTDAMKFKVRLDYGVQAIDWRAGYKNAGA